MHTTSVGSEQYSFVFAVPSGNVVCFSRSVLRVMLYAGGRANPEDDPFVINPARYDPADAMPYTFPGAKATVLCAKNASDVAPSRLICVDVVIVLDCNIVHWTNVYGQDKLTKQLVGVPMRGEHERATAFFGTVFGHNKLGMTSYSIGQKEAAGIAYRSVVFNAATPSTPKKPGTWLYSTNESLLRSCSSRKHQRTGVYSKGSSHACSSPHECYPHSFPPGYARQDRLGSYR